MIAQRPAHVLGGSYVPLRLRPVTLAEARRFIGEHHSHSIPPTGWRFGVGVESAGILVGVAVASRPVSRVLDDGATIEITRSCTDGTRNANSMLYGALVRAAKALGFKKALTYTLQSEAGTALRATGWQRENEAITKQGKWSCPSRPRHDADMFGTRRPPEEPRVRWSIAL